jgi:hypothetical protein
MNEMTSSKGIGADEDTLRQYLTDAIKTGKDVSGDELFKKMSATAQEQFLITQQDFRRLAESGDTDLMNKYLQDAKNIDKETVRKMQGTIQTVAETAAENEKNNAQRAAESKKDAEQSKAVPPASGAKAQHEAEKGTPASPALENAIKINAETAGKIAEQIGTSNEILEDIRENTGKKSSGSTKADYHEVTATVWGQ